MDIVTVRCLHTHSIAIVGVLACTLSALILLFAIKPFKQRISAVTGDNNRQAEKDNRIQLSVPTEITPLTS